ncbi:hypothetical protein AZE42_08868 [Rhizopogon vesiculosus]|uniref:Uncharacterized protein n=1 Tax=Rhizopogon vesiculosus TaxID=180088 RepID=A0A1J8QNX8_9AGAM|nr:hypothetical protein AZE42_08868 [Rhizopogon vesiculosus]
MDPLQGYGIRIGSTTYFGTSHLRSLRLTIMAPYMQATPALHIEFICVSMSRTD